MYYRQCLLEKSIDKNFDIYRTRTYLPEEFAVVGKSIKLRDDSKVLNSGWVVKEVSSTKVDELHLPDSHIEIKAHRKRTGDNTPKVKE